MILRGFTRLILFTAVCTVFYALSGGHLSVFWQPFEFCMVVGIYLVMFFGMNVKIDPLEYTPENLKRIHSAGLAGLLASIVLPTALGLIYKS
jgi:flagellar motor component MotA